MYNVLIVTKPSVATVTQIQKLWQPGGTSHQKLCAFDCVELEHLLYGVVKIQFVNLLGVIPWQQTQPDHIKSNHGMCAFVIVTRPFMAAVAQLQKSQPPPAVNGTSRFMGGPFKTVLLVC